MFCTKCGKRNEDSSTFCYACGNRLKPGPDQQPVYPQQPVPPRQTVSYTQQSEAQPERPATYASAWNKAKYTNKKIAQKKTALESDLHSNWRDMVSSPIMLILVILYTASLIVSIVSISDTMDEISYYLRMGGVDIDGAVFVGMLLGLSPSVLTVIGLWLTYVEGFKKDSPTVNTVGLNMIRIAQMIVLIFIAVVAMISFFTSCAAGGLGTGFVVLLLVAGVIVYYAMNIKTIANSIAILDAAVPHTSGIIVLAVFRIIVLFGSLCAMVISGMFGFSGLISLSAQILAVVMLFIYRARMEEMEMAFDSCF